MNINIQTIDFTARPDLNSFIQEKVSALSRMKSNIISAEVALKVDKSDTDENKICEIRLSIPGNDLFAKRNAKTFEEATNQVVSALQKQIVKRKPRE
jgi:putative sigma-54 modulation protein